MARRKRVDLRSIFTSTATRLMEEFRRTESVLAHAPDRGAPREDAIRTFLREKLPKRYAVGRGFVVNPQGEESRQTDCIIYDAATCPVLYADNGQEVVPVESVYASVEVKSRLTRKSFADGIENARAFKQVTRDDVEGDSGRALNPRVSILIAYDIDPEWANGNLDWTTDCILELRALKREERLDGVCVISEGLVVPSERDEEWLHASFLGRSEDFWFQGGGADFALPKCFVTLVTCMNEMRLETPDLTFYLHGPP